MNRFEQLRYELGITQQELSDGAHVSVSTIIRLERGRSKPNAAVAYALARFYGLTVAELMDPDGPLPRDPDEPRRAA